MMQKLWNVFPGEWLPSLQSPDRAPVGLCETPPTLRPSVTLPKFKAMFPTRLSCCPEPAEVRRNVQEEAKTFSHVRAA